MNIFTRAGIFLVVFTTTEAAQADWSGNLGWSSDYYYRGIFQASSSANGGIDYSGGGFYAGTWVADVGDGLEIDGYLGYAGEVEGFRYGVGVTGYYYTQDFDDTYEEINLSTGYGIATVDVAVGRYGGFDLPDQHYAYYSLTLEKKGFYGKYAGFSRDFSGDYVEFGYSTSLVEVDLGFAVIVASEELAGQDNESLVFSIGKTFDF